MADVNSNQYQEFTKAPQGKVEPADLEGRIRQALAQVNVDNSAGDLDTGGDVAKLTWLSKHARIAEVKVYTDGVSGLTDCDIGNNNDADGLVDGLDLSSDGVTEVIADDDSSNANDPATDLGKPLWELLGYSEAKDAPGQVELLLTANNASSGDGNVMVQFQYVVD
jgi:hypothetical protein